MRRNLRASVQLPRLAGRAPDRFRLWKAGENPGDYGSLHYTRAAHDRVMAEYNRRGNALIMDIEHALNKSVNPALDPADPPVTAGYAALEGVETADGPELWCLPRWSDCGRDAPVPDEVCCAKHQIESGQRCYVSPDWEMDLDSREPWCLNRVSLVAEPATHGINLLASASPRKNIMDEKAIRAAYALAMMQSTGAEGELKAAAAAYMAQLKTAAAALGIDVESEPAPASEVQAAAETETEQPRSAPLAAAKVLASRGLAAVTASKGLTLEDVRAELAREKETERLRGIVAARMPKGSDNIVASMSLTQLRGAARDLPAPVADAGTGGDAGGNITGNRDGAMTPQEAFEVGRIHRQLGIAGDTNLTAAKKAWDDDPTEGSVAVDVFAAMSRESRKAKVS